MALDAPTPIAPYNAPVKDLYEIGEMPPLGHVPAQMHAWTIRRERQAIGRMAVDDLELLARGLPPLVLQVAQPEAIRRRLPASPAALVEKRRA